MTLPETPFEARGKQGQWTTLSQERTYLDALLAAVPEIREEHVGYGAGGANLYAYIIGTGPRPILFVAQQHGPEVAGREIMLSRLRDWPTSTDPEIVDWLRQSTVVIMPTCHPDDLTSRNNPDGQNINREHVSLAAPEARAIHQVIRDYRPEVIADLHEMTSGPMEDIETSKMINPNALGGLLDLSEDLEQNIREVALENGYTWKPYWNYRDIGPEYLSMNAGLRHAVGLLTETSYRTGRISDSGDRYNRYSLIADRVQQWHHRNLEEVAAASLRSRREAEYLGARFDLLTGHMTRGPVLQPVPDGYTLTQEQYHQIEHHRDLFDLDVQDLQLTAQHQARGLVHYLAHDHSGEKVISAEPTFHIEQPPFDDPPVDIPARYTLRVRVGDTLRDAWFQGGQLR